MTAPVRIAKVMALSLGEFQNSITPLTGQRLAGSEANLVVGIGSGQVEIRYLSLPAVRLGGLLELPRANVIFDFLGVDPQAQAAFLKRFELAFQRGGG